MNPSISHAYVLTSKRILNINSHFFKKSILSIIITLYYLIPFASFVPFVDERM